MPNWSDRLRQQREALGLSQRELAARAGVSKETIAKYELGQRRPSRRVLTKLTGALKVSPDAANALVVDAGLDPLPTGRAAAWQRRRGPLADLVGQAQDYRWPCLVVNETFEVVGWNPLAEAVANVDFAALLPEPWQRNFMRIAVHPHFRPQVGNWEQVVSQIIGMYKQHGADPAQAEAASAYFAALVNDVAQTPYLPELMRLWATAPPFQDGTRLVLPITWRPADGAVLRFATVFTPWNDFDAAWAHDWHPADAATWRWLERARGSAGATVTAVPRTASAQEQETSWFALLRAGREGSQLTRAEVEAASGVSAHTLYAYEHGRRRPARAVVLELGRLYGQAVATTNRILEALGEDTTPSDWALFAAGLPPQHGSTWYRGTTPLPLSWERIAAEAAGFAWPCLVVDGDCAIRVANTAAEQLFGAVRGLPLTQLALSAAFRQRVANWDEAVSALVPRTLKQALLGPATATAPAVQARAASLRGSGTVPWAELERLWTTLPARANTVRVVLPFYWQADSGAALAFTCLITPWNSLDPAWALDFQPADAETWEWFAALETSPSHRV